MFKPRRNTTLHNLMFGDYDKDGVLNIDDPAPFNPNVRRARKVERNYKHYHESRYSDPEVKLSSELMAIKKYNDSHRHALQQTLRGKHAVGRVKTVPSTLHKLRERFIHKIGDVAGATHITGTRAEAFRARRRMRKKFGYIKHRSDNYYKNPKGGVYYGYHDTYNIGGHKVEVQYKSKHMKKHGERMHTLYKHKKPMDKYVKTGIDLFRRGY
jgi:hypothetical protein